MKKALIVQGGWQGHEPKQVSELFASALRGQGFQVEVSDTLDAFLERDLSRVFYLILFGNIKSLLIEHIPMSSDFV